MAKVDELMALCDRLEAARTRREATRSRLTAASLARLHVPDPDPAVFSVHARFAVDNLAHLTTRPEQVTKLRRTILDLAVRGRLLPQDLHEEAVSIALERSDRVRHTVADGDRRADVSNQALLAWEESWLVPSSWEWRALADLVLFVDYRGKTPTRVQTGVRLITAKNVKKGFISLEPQEFLTQAEFKKWMTRGYPAVGDVLFTTEAPICNAAVVRLEEPFALAQRTISFRPYGAIDPDFMVIQLLAELFQTILDKTATGLTAKGIKAAKLKRLPIAVPPMAEQRRIVAKVDELMALCNQLETSLTIGENSRSRLLGALLHEALAPTLKEAA